MLKKQGFRKNGNVAKNENRRVFGESKPVLYELQEKSWQSCRAVQQLSNELLLKLDVLGIAAVASILGNSDRASVYRFLCPPEGTRWSTTVLTSSSHGAGQGVSQDHFGSLIFQMVQELRLGSHFWLRSHFSENLVLREVNKFTTEFYVGRPKLCQWISFVLDEGFVLFGGHMYSREYSWVLHPHPI